MKKIFKINGIFSAVVWTIYFLNSFYLWDLYNPFWWVYEIPVNQNVRDIFMGIFFAYVVYFVLMYEFVLDKNGKFQLE